MEIHSPTGKTVVAACLVSTITQTNAVCSELSITETVTHVRWALQGRLASEFLQKEPGDVMPTDKLETHYYWKLHSYSEAVLVLLYQPILFAVPIFQCNRSEAILPSPSTRMHGPAEFEEFREYCFSEQTLFSRPSSSHVRLVGSFARHRCLFGVGTVQAGTARLAFFSAACNNFDGFIRRWKWLFGHFTLVHSWGHIRGWTCTPLGWLQHLGEWYISNRYRVYR